MTSFLYEELVERVRRDQTLFVAGTGVSLAATGRAVHASWSGLIKAGLQYCAEVDPTLPPGWADQESRNLDRAAASEDPARLIAIATTVERRLGGADRSGGDWRAWLERTVGRLEVADDSLVEALHVLGRGRLATCNYDDVLTRDGHPPVPWTDIPELVRVLMRDDKGIIHLHGHWKTPRSVVLGYSAYSDVLEDQAAQALQRSLASLASFVFVGFGAGLEDPNFGALLDWMSETFPDRGAHHFRLMRDDEIGRVQGAGGKNRIAVLGYGPTHASLVEFLRKLAVDAGLSRSRRGPSTRDRYRPRVPPFFGGRDEDTKQVIDDLARHHVVVVRGLGGQGKSTLAAHVLEQVEAGFSGAYWVPCEDRSLSDMLAVLARHVSPSLARRFESSEDDDWKLEELARALPEKTLLVLDDARPSSDLRLVAAASKVIVTTRGALDLSRFAVHGEKEIVLGSVSEREGVKILRQISACEETPATAELVRELGALPLALRVAGRTMLELRWSAEQYLRGFQQSGTLSWLTEADDAPVVVKAFELSYRQLPESAAETFRVLGLFTGGLVATRIVERVARQGPGEVPRNLLTLSRRGIIDFIDPDAIGVHPLIGRYARELLSRRPERNELHHRCAEDYKARLSNWDAKGRRFRHSDGQPGDVALAAEAARHFIEAGMPRAAQEVLVGTADIIAKQGRERLLHELILQSEAGASPIEPWLEVYRSASVLRGLVRGDAGRARSALEGLGAGEEDPRVASAALIVLAKHAIDSRQMVQASGLLSRARTLKELMKDDRGVAYILNEQARICAKTGRAEQALELHAQALQLQRLSKDDEGTAYSLRRMASLYLRGGTGTADAAKALDLLQEAGSLNRRSKLVMVTILLEKAEAYRRLGRDGEAAGALAQAHALARETDDTYSIFQTLRRKAVVLEREGQLGRALVLALQQREFMERCSADEHQKTRNQIYHLQEEVQRCERELKEAETALAKTYRERERARAAGRYMSPDEFKRFKANRRALIQRQRSLSAILSRDVESFAAGPLGETSDRE